MTASTARSITVDHGPEFEGQALDAWAYKRAVRVACIRPGKPVENAYVESLNGRFRDIEYNTRRPHSSLDDLTPEEFRDAQRSRTTAAGAR